jgi:hypothetical protein
MKFLSNRMMLALVLVLASGAVLRISGAAFLDGILPLDGLYVDEVEYSRGLDALRAPPFLRPPGTYILAWAGGLPGNVEGARILFSLFSMIPALVILAAFGDSKWGIICAVAAALDPLTAFFGLHILPAAPAAALLAMSLLAAKRGRLLMAGFLVGCSALFRGEILLLLLLFPLFLCRSPGRRLATCLRFALSALVPVLPVILVNLASGAGPVLSINGAENFWLGTSWELASTPPGVEFEALMRLDSNEETPDQHFMELALERICDSPLSWVGMGFRKVLATLSFPGPGRNVELTELIRRMHFVLLLPLTLLIMSLALTRSKSMLCGKMSERLALSMIAAAFLAAFLFIPAARYRTAYFPAAFFLAASRPPSRREILPWLATSLILAGLSILVQYPGAPRRGLTEVQSAQQQLSRGRPDLAIYELRRAASRGYTGADLHNIAGASLMTMGRTGEGTAEFERALELAPGSPTLWRNSAVALWNSGRYDESLEAAQRAVILDPLLRTELGPLLEWKSETEP